MAVVGELRKDLLELMIMRSGDKICSSAAEVDIVSIGLVATSIKCDLPWASSVLSAEDVATVSPLGNHSEDPDCWVGWPSLLIVDIEVVIGSSHVIAS